MANFTIIGLMIFYFLCCFVLIGSILLQSGKGGGLSSLAGGGGTGIADALGATSAEKTLGRITTFFAIGFMVLAIVISVMGKYQSEGDEALEIFPEAPAAAVAPVIPGEIPGEAGASGVEATTIPFNDQTPKAISEAISRAIPGGDLPDVPVEEGVPSEN